MTYVPGDILLVNDYTGQGDLLGNLIRAGEKARYGKDAPADTVYWTHSALIVSTEGDLIEAMAQGVAWGHVSEYAAVPTKIIHIPATPRERDLITQGAKQDVGLEYNRVDFASLATQLLFGVDWGVNDGRADICSELVSRYTEKVIPRYPYKPGDMMPLDIDAYYGAPVGGPLSRGRRWLLLAQALWWWARPWKHGIKP